MSRKRPYHPRLQLMGDYDFVITVNVGPSPLKRRQFLPFGLSRRIAQHDYETFIIATPVPIHL